MLVRYASNQYDTTTFCGSKCGLIDVCVEMRRGTHYIYSCDGIGCDSCRMRFICYTTREVVYVYIEKLKVGLDNISTNDHENVGLALEKYMGV